MADVLKALEQGTSLVCSLAEGRIPIGRFLQEYGDFYHYNALDGHEGAVGRIPGLDEQASIIRLHERVQEIAYDVYDADAPLAAYEDAGRILPGEAERRIVAVARELDASRLLRRIREVDDKRKGPPED
jgi:hypothetical protein